ncbi:hypothetical protein MMC17_007698 [Xylographa soralifera]|nr:hypothetical protein [Xylographa soralifera]
MEMSTIVLYLTLFLALVFGGAVTLYMTTDAGKDVMEWVGERFFKYKAKAEEKALEQAGEGQAREFLKDQLKKNPVMSTDELNSIQGGLGDEAMKQFGGGKGGLGAMLGAR